MEGDRRTHGPQATRQVGRARRRHRHRDRKAPSTPARHVRRRSALRSAARAGQADRRSTERGTVSWLVRRYVAGRTDITLKSRESYEWAIPHIEAGLGAIPVARLDREDVAEWIEGLASAGELSRRSVQICRTVLRAALADAVDEGIIPRSPAARVAFPRTVAKPAKVKEIEAWDAARGDPLPRGDPRAPLGGRVPPRGALRAAPQRGPRAPLGRPRRRGKTVRIDESVVAVSTGAAWSDAKNERSRRRIPLDDETCGLKRRRSEQATERLLAGARGRTTT